MYKPPGTQQKAPGTEREVKCFEYNCYHVEHNGADIRALRKVPKKGWIQHDFRIQGLSELRDSIRLQLRLSHHGLQLQSLTLSFKGEGLGRDLMNELDFETEILPQLRGEDKESFFSVVIEAGAPSFEQWPLPSYVNDLFWLELPQHLQPQQRQQPQQHHQGQRFSKRGMTQDIRVNGNGHFDSSY